MINFDIYKDILCDMDNLSEFTKENSDEPSLHSGSFL